MMNRDYFERLDLALGDNCSLWQATIIATDGSSPAKAGMKACIGEGKLYFGNLGGGELEHGIIAMIRECKPITPQRLLFDLGGKKLDGEESQATGMICGGTAEVFIEPLHRGDRLYIIGAGHCGRALSELAMKTGFYTTIIDNRLEIVEAAKRDLICDKAVHSDYTDIAAMLEIPQTSYLVIMTHGHLHDKDVLRQCISLPLKYLGMIGSKNKVRESFARLKEQGISEEDLALVHAPIGMAIGSQTPVEIAISIMAEIISIRSQDRKS